MPIALVVEYVAANTKTSAARALAGNWRALKAIMAAGRAIKTRTATATATDPAMNWPDNVSCLLIALATFAVVDAAAKRTAVA